MLHIFVKTEESCEQAGECDKNVWRTWCTGECDKYVWSTWCAVECDREYGGKYGVLRLYICISYDGENNGD